jgi:hypothetical protein
MTQAAIYGRKGQDPVASQTSNGKVMTRTTLAVEGTAYGAKGEPEAIAGLWDTDRRGCARWLPLEKKPGDHTDGQ